MIPVVEEQIKLVEIQKEKYADYLKSEIVYLTNKRVVEEIITKVLNIFDVLQNKKHIDYNFFKSICCDFTKLESVYKNYKI